MLTTLTHHGPCVNNQKNFQKPLDKFRKVWLDTYMNNTTATTATTTAISDELYIATLKLLGGIATQNTVNTVCAAWQAAFDASANAMTPEGLAEWKRLADIHAALVKAHTR